MSLLDDDMDSTGGLFKRLIAFSKRLIPFDTSPTAPLGLTSSANPYRLTIQI